MDILKETQDLFEYTRALRRDFHRHPELGFQEVRTAEIVARELNALGLEVMTGVAKTGVVGLLECARPGPVVMLRFDMDALPILEETGAEYASENPGVMHACGHDAHTAIGLTAAKILQAYAQELAGTVKFVFQPAEEGLGGAQSMVAEGVLENPRPEVALGLHVWNEEPLGMIAVSPGPFMAASEIFTLTLTGRGGHGALPHQTVDPVVAAAQVITALQTIPARNVPPLSAAVISVTSVHAGDAFNVIPQKVEMKGTIRSFEPEVRSLVLERFQQVVNQTAAAFGCQAEVEIQTLTPAVINHPEVTARVQAQVAKLFPDHTLSTSYRTMGSEDMAFLMEDIPGCFFFVGSANPELGLDAKHHHPKFDIDERVLPRAVALIVAAAVDYLNGAA